MCREKGGLEKSEATDRIVLFRFALGKSAAQTALLITGLIFAVYGILMTFSVNFNAGTVLILGLGAFFLTAGALYNAIRKRIYLYVGLWAFLALVIVGVAFAVTVLIYGLNNNPSYDEDAVIVLGCGIRGEEVPNQLAGRLEAALAYHKANPDAVIVVSGGKGPGEDITEALAMERYLTERGVPKSKILKEEASTSTYTNLTFSKEILDGRLDRPYKAVLITSEYHIYRAIRLSEELGFSCTHFHGNTAWYELPVRCAREVMAIVKTFFVDTL